jgi:membrane-bound acyltransferase YfiQ involved in biofilm formation
MKCTTYLSVENNSLNPLLESFSEKSIANIGIKHKSYTNIVWIHSYRIISQIHYDTYYKITSESDWLSLITFVSKSYLPYPYSKNTIKIFI